MQSPHCFDSQHKKMTTLHTKHTTLNTIWHTNYTLQTRYMSQIFQHSESERKIDYIRAVDPKMDPVYRRVWAPFQSSKVSTIYAISRCTVRHFLHSRTQQCCLQPCTRDAQILHFIVNFSPLMTYCRYFNLRIVTLLRIFIILYLFLFFF